uniref:Uncharacterized protein n=1 Tax=Anguilla anguilla TaxID=7936 RepID=A0A0E9VH95_ANGAN
MFYLIIGNGRDKMKS